ncbi:ethanolamine ammonia-lyase subunit EutC [Caulobacter sp. KR2-114]|uniref:ethanolamine ammonia-lyase subunit EutC n=1 Tax=Caulobacter sp. KR2-114 TaxID=3400912 RepID=UPI003C034CB3
MAAEPTELALRLRRLTLARVGLGRSGASQTTADALAFALAHARARDAVHDALDAEALAEAFAVLGHAVIQVRSAAPDRRGYLLRPDLGRTLAADAVLDAAGPFDLAVVAADGLSARAVQAHAAPLLAALAPRLEGLTLSPVVIAHQARVALGDAIGARLLARAVLVLIGERPGLSSPDSLGAYLTFDPREGRTDAERNCVSNIRPEGLGYEAAAVRLAWLVREALGRRLTGVGLKDESDLPSIDAGSPNPSLT